MNFTFYKKIVALLLFASPFLAMAQVEIRADVLGNGGTAMESSGLQLNGTVGQPLIGLTNSANNGQQIGFWYQPAQVLTSVEQIAPTSTGFRLKQNFPNPAATVTTIPFAIPQDASIRLVVVNSSGQVVARLIEGKWLAGTYQAELDVSQFPVGTYWYQFYVDELLLQSRKLMVQR